MKNYSLEELYENANKIYHVNHEIDEHYQNLKLVEELKSIFRDVYVVQFFKADENNPYSNHKLLIRLGSKSDEALLGKDYVVIEKLYPTDLQKLDPVDDPYTLYLGYTNVNPLNTRRPKNSRLNDRHGYFSKNNAEENYQLIKRFNSLEDLTNYLENNFLVSQNQ